MGGCRLPREVNKRQKNIWNREKTSSGFGRQKLRVPVYLNERTLDLGGELGGKFVEQLTKISCPFTEGETRSSEPHEVPSLEDKRPCGSICLFHSSCCGSLADQKSYRPPG